MDPWKEFAALENGRDMVRRWAALEGKSRTMSDDLVRGSSLLSPAKPPVRPWSFAAHLGAVALELWRLMRSG